MRQLSAWMRVAIIGLAAASPKNGHAANADDPAPTRLGSRLMCNTIDANGLALPYDIEPSHNNSVLVRDARGSPSSELEVSQVSQSDSRITFSLKVQDRVLSMKIWGGFHRPFSLIDGREVSGPSEGLPFLVGVCDEKQKVVPVVHRFSDQRYPLIDGKKVQNCFSVTLDGRYFTSVNVSSTQESAAISTSGPLGAPQYSRVQLKDDGFPPLPEREGFFTAWRSFRPDRGAKGPSFVSEFELNLETMLAAEIWDFQTLDEVNAPLMVARGHCGFFPVVRQGATTP